VRTRASLPDGANKYPNVALVKVTIPDPRNKVAVVSD
jgi:hypothetical protein